MGRKKKEKKLYFDYLEEQAVIDYITTDSEEVKNEIYENVLKEPFRKMVESISKKYPLHLGNYSLEEVQQYALSHLIEQMISYNPNRILEGGRKPKAFSYCQTIVRNFYIKHSKETSKEKTINLPYDDYQNEIEKKDDFLYEIDDYDDKYIELIDLIIDKIKEVLDNSSNLKTEEIMVGEAIINVLDNWDILFMEEVADSEYNMNTSKKFAKNKILLFLKEQTRLSTKEIRLAMKPFTEIYFLEKSNLFE
jgi:hypothetical protein